MKPPVADVLKACTAEKLLAVTAGENVLRLLPPLNITDAELTEGIARLSRALRRVSTS
jgi:acetylornithine/N-succinyldiaminopimelate aminotransferase